MHDDESVSPDRSGSSERPRVLVIEPDPADRVVLTRLLEQEGCHVRNVSEGAAGIEITRSFRPHLTICEWTMTGMNGIDYCRCVKSDPRLRETYIMLLTARDEADDRVAGLDSGADSYLTKPFVPAEFQARVRAGLRLRRLQSDLGTARHRSALLEMAATLGHEINNPLTALIGHMELVQRYLEREDHDRMTHHADEAQKLASRIGTVAHRLVQLAEPEAVPYVGESKMLDIEGRGAPRERETAGEVSARAGAVRRPSPETSR